MAENKKYNWEYRAANGLTAAETDGKMFIQGKAICFNVPSSGTVKIGNRVCTEVIRPTALDGCDLSNVLLKINHDQRGMTLARTRNKSLQLERRADGLYFKAELPDTQAGRDVYTTVKSGLMNDVSFGFRVSEQRFDREKNIRYVEKIPFVREISIVDDGAYQEAGVEAMRDFCMAEIGHETSTDIRRKKIKLRTYWI